METGTGIRNFLEYAIGCLIAAPERAIVDCSQEDDKLVFLINLSEEDTESLAGTTGRTMSSLRSLAQASAHMHQKRAFIKLEGEERYKPKFRDDPRGHGGGRDRDRRGGGRDRRGGRSSR